MIDPCPHCQAAAQQRHHGFDAGCQQCRARMLSRSPWFAASKRAGKLTQEYIVALAQADLSHAEVKAAATADVMQETT